jgi:hypothetical protein
MVVGAQLDGPQCPTGGGGLVRPAWPELTGCTLRGYGAPFSVFSLPTEPVECEELTKGVFYRLGAPEQDVRWQGSSLNLQRWWGNAPMVGSRQG